MTTEYKTGDKVVVEIERVDVLDGMGKSYYAGKAWIKDNSILGKLEDFNTAQEKIKMTVEEKKEFDELKRIQSALFSAFDEIDVEEYPHLFKKLFGYFETQEKNQLEFAKYWEHPELIEVVHEDVRTVKIAGLYLCKYLGEYEKLVDDFDMRNENFYFTKSEVEQINKLEKFNNVDVVAAWEDGK